MSVIERVRKILFGVYVMDDNVLLVNIGNVMCLGSSVLCRWLLLRGWLMSSCFMICLVRGMVFDVRF